MKTWKGKKQCGIEYYNYFNFQEGVCKKIIEQKLHSTKLTLRSILNNENYIYIATIKMVFKPPLVK